MDQKSHEDVPSSFLMFFFTVPMILTDTTIFATLDDFLKLFSNFKTRLCFWLKPKYVLFRNFYRWQKFLLKI